MVLSFSESVVPGAVFFEISGFFGLPTRFWVLMSNLLISLKTKGQYYLSVGTEIIWSKRSEFAIIPDRYHTHEAVTIIDLKKASMEVFRPEPITSIVQSDFYCKSTNFDFESFRWISRNALSFLATIVSNPYAEQNNCSRSMLNKTFGKYIITIPLGADTIYCTEYDNQ